MSITLFFRNISASFSAPASLILLSSIHRFHILDTKIKLGQPLVAEKRIGYGLGPLVADIIGIYANLHKIGTKI